MRSILIIGEYLVGFVVLLLTLIALVIGLIIGLIEVPRYLRIKLM